MALKAKIKRSGKAKKAEAHKPRATVATKGASSRRDTKKNAVKKTRRAPVVGRRSIILRKQSKRRKAAKSLRLIHAKRLSAAASPPLFRGNRQVASGPKYFFSTDIPKRYDETFMRAMPRDPFWIFVYWEISKSVIDDLNAKLYKSDGAARWVLRVSDVTDIEYDGKNAWRSMDIAITLDADTWYFKIWEPGRMYTVQAGFVGADGAFFEAVRSNTVGMPREGVSALTDEEWSDGASDELIGMSARLLKRSFGASERLGESEIGAGLSPDIGQGSGSGAIF